jgi:hypothetical protein
VIRFRAGHATVNPLPTHAASPVPPGNPGSFRQGIRFRPGPSHYGEAVQEAGLARAEHLVAEGLQRMGWWKTDLQGRRKAEPGKVELAWELRSRTTMSLAWIAGGLNMSSRGHLVSLLQQQGNSGLSAPADQYLLRIGQSH